MPSRPWYKWYPGDFLADTRMLSLEEQGAYRALLDHIWMNGPFEPTTANLRRILAVDTRVVRRIWPVLSPYLSLSYGLVDHPKLAEQRAEALEKQQKARKSGRSGGLANARATRARASAHPRPQPDPDPDKDLPRVSSLGSELNPPARAREGNPGLRAEAERLQAELERRREQLGIEPPAPSARLAAVAGRVVGQAKLGNSETREEES